MRFKKYLFLIAMAALLFLSCSCAKGGKIEISPSDKSLVDLASTTYDTQVLSNIIGFNGSMRELNDKYPIECLRKDGGIEYPTLDRTVLPCSNLTPREIQL